MMSSPSTTRSSSSFLTLFIVTLVLLQSISFTTVQALPTRRQLYTPAARAFKRASAVKNGGGRTRETQPGFLALTKKPEGPSIKYKGLKQASYTGGPTHHHKGSKSPSMSATRAGGAAGGPSPSLKYKGGAAAEEGHHYYDNEQGPTITATATNSPIYKGFKAAVEGFKTAIMSTATNGPAQAQAHAPAAEQTQPATYENDGQDAAWMDGKITNKREASIREYLNGLMRRAEDDEAILAALAADTSSDSSAPEPIVTSIQRTLQPKKAFAAAAVDSPKALAAEDDAAPTSSKVLGGEYHLFASAAGVEDQAAKAPSSQTVTAEPTLLKRVVAHPGAPTAEGIVVGVSKRELRARVVAHPGAPTNTIKINVVGGEIFSSFTLISPTATPAASTTTRATEKVATTTAKVNIIGNITDALPTTSPSISSSSSSTRKSLPTVTQTLTFTPLPSNVETVTVILVPTHKPSSTEEVYVPIEDVANECSSPVNASIVDGASITGTTTTATLCGSTKDGVKVTVHLNSQVSVDVDGDSNDSTPSTKKVRRNAGLQNFFELPASSSKFSSSISRDEMMSEDWEDCVVGVDEDCLEIPSDDDDDDDSTSRTATTSGSSPSDKDRRDSGLPQNFFELPSSSSPSVTRDEMMSEDWEDCLVGVDDGCLEIPLA